MAFFVDPDGHYYEGDARSELDTRVTRRPGAEYVWNGAAWVEDLTSMALSLPELNPAQIRRQLSIMGLRAAVEAAVTAGSQDLQDLWQHSPSFRVTHPEVLAMAADLGVSNSQLIYLFTEGSKLI